MDFKEAVIIYLFFEHCIAFSFIKNDSDITKSHLHDFAEKRIPRDYGWGFVDWYQEIHTSTLKENTPVKIVTTKNIYVRRPCKKYISKMPDFTEKNRRLSEVKCYEYIWGINDRQVKFWESQNCKTHRKKMMEAILDSQKVIPSEFPHMAAIGWAGSSRQWVFKCAGSLISHKFVLTAAHCGIVADTEPKVIDTIPKIVRLGITNNQVLDDADPQHQDINIQEFITHPHFKEQSRYNDIALIRLENEVVFSKLIGPACMWTNKNISKLGPKGIATGWGAVEIDEHKKAPNLEKTKVDFVKNSYCKILLRPWCSHKWCGLKKHQFCAETLSCGTTLCKADFGGVIQVPIPTTPLAEEKIYYIVGIASYSFKHKHRNTPSIYTKISSFLKWIEGLVWPQN